MPAPSALHSAVMLPAALLAILIAASFQRASAAELIGAEQVIDLVGAAKHIAFGSPQVVTLAIGGRKVAFTVTVGSLGAITAVPVVADTAVKQISITVTTTNSGVVPNAVTVITGDGQVLGFTVVHAADGAVVALAEGAPLSLPPRRNAVAGDGHDGKYDQGGDRAGAAEVHHGPPSDLVDEQPPLTPGAASPGGGLLYAPGTSPLSQFVSPH
jgi:hypothetical protein